MKVMLLNSVFHPQAIGGAEAVVLALARGLSARGIDVDVLATTGRRAGPAGLAERIVDGVAGTVYEAPLAGLYDLLGAGERPRAPLPVRAVHHALGVRSERWQRLACEALGRSRPDILHTHNLVGLTPAVWGAAHGLGVPIVHTLHDYHLLCARTTLLRRHGALCESPPLPCLALLRAKLKQAEHVDIVTAPSRYALERHAAAGAFPRSRAEVVPNAAAPSPAPPRPRPDTPARGLYLGQLQVHKGVRELLAAVASLLGADGPPDFEFLLAGAGPLAGEVAAFCATSGGRCRFLGRVEGSEREAAFAAASFLVLPSRWPEVAGLVIQEANSRGLPVIATRRGGIPELLSDGETGLLVEPEPAALAAAMALYARDPALRRRHAAAALSRSSALTPARQVDAYLRLYEELLAGKRAGG